MSSTFKFSNVVLNHLKAGKSLPNWLAAIYASAQFKMHKDDDRKAATPWRRLRGDA